MRHTWIITLTILILGAGGSYLLYLQLIPQPLPDQILYGNGHIEGSEVRVSAEVSGRVIENFMTEGGAVAAKTVLVRIDPTRLELSLAKAESEIAAIKYEQAEVQMGLETARHHFNTAKREFERYSELSERSVVSTQQTEKAEFALEEARGHVGALEAKAKAVGARLEAAEFSLRLIDTELAKTSVKAPIDGTILVKAVEEGEFLSIGGTVGVIVDLSRLELRVFVPEMDIGKVHLNDSARVRVDAFPDRSFEGKVIRVDEQAQFTPREIHVPEERTRMVFGVTLAIENTDGSLKPGMPADAWILWKEEGVWPERLFIPE